MDLVSDICALSAREMARLIFTRKLSARETVEAHLQQIERVNPGVNAIVTITAEHAVRQAAQADEAQAHGLPMGPLHGLPTAHKDLQPTRGIRTTFGSRIFRDFVPEEDSLLVERVKDAGAILLGKTNTPEFGAGSQTFNEVFGPTLNPFDRAKTCGGSSGGAAAALACHMLPIADGTDLGGSLRNPASFCNVVGLRPSPGRVPVRPSEGLCPMGVEGPVARTVDDLAFYFTAMADFDPRFEQPLGRDFRGVRVAWWKDLGGIPIDRRVREITNAQKRVFESIGCIVEEAEPDFAGADEAFRALRFWSTSIRLGEHARRHPALVKDTLLWEIEQGNKLTMRSLEDAELKYLAVQQNMRRFMESYEFFVLPVSQVLPFDVTQHYPADIDGVRMETYIDWMKSCYYISVTGAPALSVPCGFAGGLPVGIQIVGRHLDDWGLLQIARAFEHAAT
ncbi:MAG TPA: amidase [Bryobacteraceae bacterium]|nr:amidase [Bryobacteraceae bacterium]